MTSKYKPGDDVIAHWDETEVRGVVDKIEGHGWLRLRVIPDMTAEYNRFLDDVLTHKWTIAVRESDVRPYER